VSAWEAAARAAVAGCADVDGAMAHARAAIAGGASEMHAADLALAWCAAAGDARAVKRFDGLAKGEMAAAARAIDRAPAFVDEIVQQTRVRLLVGDRAAGEAPRIASYRGTGPLRAWAAIAAQRIALNAKRGAKTGPASGDDGALAAIVDREPDVELRHLKQLYRSELASALAAALAGLPDRARAILRLRFVDGLELAQLGRLYGVHESTASRWVTAALDDVGRAARDGLVARLAIGRETADSVARIVQSGLDLSVARLLM
jgi:RNA polymerase sigma-70 factor (ECF subfamily)